MPTQKFTDQQKQQLSAWFQRRYESNFAWKSAASAFLMLPGIRGVWTLGQYDSTGNALEYSGNTRLMTLNGDPQYNYDTLMPYVQLDGTGDYFARADEAGTSITGTETIVETPARGLYMASWVYFDNAAGAIENIQSKWGAAGQRSYRMIRHAGGFLGGVLSVDGTAVTTALSTSAIAQTAWQFCAVTFDPSTSIDVYLNGELTQTVAAIPASIFDSTTDYRWGVNGSGTQLMTGRFAISVLGVNYLPSHIILSLFHQTKAAFGVK